MSANHAQEIRILSVSYIGYDPGTVYYSATFSVDGGSPKTAKLSEIKAAADGLLSRGMSVDPVYPRIYQAAYAAAKADWHSLPLRPKKHIA